MKRHLTWIGHALRMKDDRIPKQILLGKSQSQWRRECGRPRQTWDRIVHAETRCLTDHVRNFAGLAKDWLVEGRLWLAHLGDLASSRNQWRHIANELVCNHRQ